jgi:alpha-L-fucosidase
MNEIETQFSLAGAALMKVVGREVRVNRRCGTFHLTAAVAVALLLQAGGSHAAERPGLALPSPQQAEWQDYEVGMFVHFAPNTWLDKEYDDLSKPLKDLNPSQLDTEQWAKVAEAMGAKYIVFVAKHVGGFCWWQTDSTDYGARQLPWRGGKGDVMADLSRSCREHGLKLGVYLSPADRHFGVGVGGKAEDPAKQAGYQKLFRQQLTESR